MIGDCHETYYSIINCLNMKEIDCICVLTAGVVEKDTSYLTLEIL